MSEYMPTTDDILAAWQHFQHAGESEEPRRADFFRWLAAHDAEVRARAFAEAAGVARNYDTGYDTTAATIAEALTDAAAWRTARAGVVAEEPEWEYGVEYLHYRGPEVSIMGEASARATAARTPEDWKLVCRTKAIPAGPWVPVKQENDHV